MKTVSIITSRSLFLSVVLLFFFTTRVLGNSYSFRPLSDDEKTRATALFNEAYDTPDYKMDLKLNTYLQVLEADPTNISQLKHLVLNNLGSLFENNGDIDKAKKYYKDCLKEKPDFSKAVNNLLRVDTISPAAALFEYTYNNIPDSLSDVKIQYYERVILLYNNEKEHYAALAYNNMGVLYKNNCEYDKAVECYKKAVELKPDFTTAKNNLEGMKNSSRAKLLVNKGYNLPRWQVEEQRELFQQVIDEGAQGDKRQLAFAYNNIGTIYADCGDMTLALEYFRKATQIDTIAVARRNLERLDSAMMINGMFELARSIPDSLTQLKKQRYQKIIDLDPNNIYGRTALAYNNLGVLCENTHDFEGAESFYLIAHEIDPNLEISNNNLKGIKLRNKFREIFKLPENTSKNRKKKIKEYEELIDEDSDGKYINLSNAYNNIGVLYKKNGKYDKAIEHYKKSLELDPNNTLPKENLESLTEALEKDRMNRNNNNSDLFVDILEGVTQILGEVQNFRNNKTDFNSVINNNSSSTSLSNTNTSSSTSHKQKGPNMQLKHRDSQTYSNFESQLIRMSTDDNGYKDSDRRYIQSQMRSLRQKWENQGEQFYHSSWEDWGGK